MKKGIILAGGSGTRLYPTTKIISKQLMPIYDKPMIYYPLSTLMLAGIRDILIITTPTDISSFKALLGDGSHWGFHISYEIQKEPRGIAQALQIGRKFIDNDSVCLILGDNIFWGHKISEDLNKMFNKNNEATIFTYRVNDPERYGVVEFNDENKAISLEEKPKKPKSNFAVTGLYFYSNDVVNLADSLKPSKRGELEITDLNRIYLDQNRLNVVNLGRGVAWLDTGTHGSMLQASNFVETVQSRQGLKICCPEEISYRTGYINEDQLHKIAYEMRNNDYGKYLLNIINDKDF